MRRHRRLLPLIIAVLILVWLANSGRQAVVNQPLTDSRNVAVQASYHLAEGQVSDGSLAALAETVHLDSGSQVAGNAALVGSSITVGGQVDGDLTAIGSTLTLDQSAQINGNATLTGATVVVSGQAQVGGNLTVAGEKITISPDAQISGHVTQCVITFDKSLMSSLPGQAQIGCPKATPLTTHRVSAFTTLMVSLVLCGLSALAVTVFPRQMGSIEQAMRAIPGKLARTGFVTLVLAAAVSAGVVVILAILPPLGLIVLPLYMLAAVGFFGLALAGWAPLALMIGERLLNRRGAAGQYPPLVMVAFGSVVMTLFLQALALLPFGALIILPIVAGLSAVSLGGALETRLGTRSPSGGYFV